MDNKKKVFILEENNIMSKATNTIVITGRLGQDMEFKDFGNDNGVATGRVAFSDKYKKNDEWVEDTHWFTVKHFGRNAQSFSQRYQKGDMVSFVGSLKSNEYMSEGNKRTEIYVQVDNAQLMKRSGETVSDSNPF